MQKEEQVDRKASVAGGFGEGDSERVGLEDWEGPE